MIVKKGVLRMELQKYLAGLNAVREANGFLPIDEITNVIAAKNTVFDCFSLLISKKAKIGKDNIFYPNVIISCDKDSKLVIGDINCFFSSTRFVAENGGEIVVGSRNEFGSGGVCIKANIPESSIVFGSHGRYDGRINIFGSVCLKTVLKL